MCRNGQGWVCSGFPASAEEVESLLAADIKPNKIINLKLDDAIVQQVVARLRGRRRDKYSRKIVYLEAQAHSQDDGTLEKLLEDRGELPSEAAAGYRAGYDKLQKALAKLGQVENVAAGVLDEMEKTMTQFVTLIP